MKSFLSGVFLLCALITFGSEIKVSFPKLMVSHVAQDVTIQSTDSLVFVKHLGKVHTLVTKNGSATYTFTPQNTDPIQLSVYSQTLNTKANEAFFKALLPDGSSKLVKVHGIKVSSERGVIPIAWSIVPPLLAIVLALLFKEVVFSLLLGIFVGTAIMGYFSGGISEIPTAFFGIITEYLLPAAMDQGHMSVILFSTLIGGIVAVVSKNGGMAGVVERIAKKVSNSRSAQWATYLLGIGIFFDDYANTLVVGNTMRPLTDRMRISREKLAYLVDSTAAPVAAIGFISTWIGAELGYISDGMSKLESTSFLDNASAYSVFLNSIPYSFYPIFTLIFMAILIWKKKDFGPMFFAEREARFTKEATHVTTEKTNDDEFTPKEGIKPQAYFALIPILVVVLGTLVGLIHTGYDPAIWANETLGFGRKLSATIGDSDSYQALLWASFTGLVIAIALSVGGKKLKLTEAVEAAITGFKAMIPAIIILMLAWSLATVTEQMHTADFLTQLLGDSLPPVILPAITFVLAAIVAFATGSSWGTMAILYPLIIPTCVHIGTSAGLDPAHLGAIFLNVIASVLAGSVLGDHCSPISDTTILSSLASQCEHIKHVKTQMPYALTVGAVALCVGVLPAAFGISPWLLLPIGVVVLYLIVLNFGKYPELKSTQTDN